MSLWLKNFLIGEDKSNMITAGNMVSRCDAVSIEEKKVGKNVKGNLNKVRLDKNTDNIRVQCSFMSVQTKNALQSAINNALRFVYFKPLDDGFTNVETRTPLDVNTVKIISTSRRFITIDSIVLASAPGGTNYGGNIDEETGIVTFALSLPSVEDVIINYTYKGWLGDIEITGIPVYNVQEIEKFNMSFLVRGK